MIGRRARRKSKFLRQVTRKMPGPKIRRNPRRRLCASLRSRKPHQHITRACWRENLQEKCRAPRLGRPLCASLHSRMDIDISPRAIYARMYREKNRGPRPGMHMDIWKEPFYEGIYRRKRKTERVCTQIQPNTFFSTIQNGWFVEIRIKGIKFDPQTRIRLRILPLH